MDVSVRELKNRLSAYLRQVQDGHEIIITSRGRAVGRLTAPSKTPKDSEEEAIARLRAFPWIRPGKGGKPQGAKHPIRIKPGEKTLAEIISEDRG